LEQLCFSLFHSTLQALILFYHLIKNQAHFILSPVPMNFGSSSLSILQPQAPTSFDAVDFAYRLSKLSTFLPAAHELLSVLSEHKYIIITRKVLGFCLVSFFIQAFLKQRHFDRRSGFWR
jgi:hypothetical protein